MTLRTSTPGRGARLPLAAVMAAAALAVWSAAMLNALWIESLYGPLCGAQGHGLVIPHCPACSLAAALLLAALVIAVAPWPRPARMAARAR